MDKSLSNNCLHNIACAKNRKIVLIFLNISDKNQSLILYINIIISVIIIYSNHISHQKNII